MQCHGDCTHFFHIHSTVPINNTLAIFLLRSRTIYSRFSSNLEANEIQEIIDYYKIIELVSI